MNLKNPDLFRSWLIRQLEPICKANPEPVSKYVCALLKKEKSDDELRESLVSQLDIFLDSATEEFVTFLIDVLKEEKYMTNDANFRAADASKSSENEDGVELKLADSDAEEERRLAETKEDEQPSTQALPRKSPSPIQAPTPSPPRKTSGFHQRSRSPRPRRSYFRNERRRVGGAAAAAAVAASHSRRSRRDNSSRLDSPPTGGGGAGSGRQMARKRSASGSSESSSTKSPRRSWIASRSSNAPKKYKHRRFTSRISPPGACSRSPSPLKMSKRRALANNSNFSSKRLPPQPDSRSNSTDNERNLNCSPPMKRISATFVGDVPDLPAAMVTKANLPMMETVTRSTSPPFGQQQKQRCVDFESKGYCARGDMCPFDHGPSPIVLDNNLLNGIVPIPPPPVHHAFPNSVSYMPPFVNAGGFAPTKPPLFRPENGPPPSIVPNCELISVAPNPEMGNSMPPSSNRELVSVPMLSLPPQKAKNSHYAGKTSYGHVFSSLPPGVSQTTIELTNVPAEFNNIPDLYDNFSPFGSLTLIQAKRNNDPSVALLTFSNATEAALAFINVDHTAMPLAKPAWYADKCILALYPRKSIPAGGLGATSKTYVINRKAPPPATVVAPTSASSAASPTLHAAAGADAKANPSAPTGAAASKSTSQPSENASSIAAATTGAAVAAAATAPTATLSAVEGKCQAASSSSAAVAVANEKMRQDPGRLLSNLIKKKRELLDKQLASRKEILEKMKNMEPGSKDEKMWQEVLRKLNDVISNNENSIKVSLQQRKEYLQKMNIVPMDSAALNILKIKQQQMLAAANAAAAAAAAAAAPFTPAAAASTVSAAATYSSSATVSKQTSTQAAAEETQHQTVSSATKLLEHRVAAASSEVNTSDGAGGVEENFFDNEDFSELDQGLSDDDDDDDDDAVAADADEVASTSTTVITNNNAMLSSTATKSSHNNSTSADISSSSNNGGAGSGGHNASRSVVGGPTAAPEYTRVVVSGFENGDEGDLLQHFSRFGAILDKEFDNTIPSATLIYDNRAAAEEAKRDGRNFQDRLLSVTVYSSKKLFQPFARRVPEAMSSAAYKSQYDAPYGRGLSSYLAAGGVGGGGNPYKYKNPQISAATAPLVAPRVSVARNVYMYRAEQPKLRVISNRSTQRRTVSENNAKILDDDDLLSDDNLIEDLD